MNGYNEILGRVVAARAQIAAQNDAEHTLVDGTVVIPKGASQKTLDDVDEVIARLGRLVHSPSAAA